MWLLMSSNNTLYFYGLQSAVFPFYSHKVSDYEACTCSNAAYIQLQDRQSC